jgi:hypothetical protein
MRSLESPSAAIRMILARTTSQYGDVYRRAMPSNSCRSSAERCTTYGLCLGINARSFAETSLSDYVTKWANDTSPYLRMEVLSVSGGVGLYRYHGPQMLNV